MTPEQTNELFRTLGRIESRLDAWDARLSTHIDADEDANAVISATAAALDKRITTLEKLLWKAAGALTVISIAATEAWRRLFP